jgi:hypothetical protein
MAYFLASFYSSFLISDSRRRHGIPDDDDRPFNVAYAAAALARREREREQHRKAKLEALHTQGSLEQQRRDRPMDTLKRTGKPTGTSLNIVVTLSILNYM